MVHSLCTPGESNSWRIGKIADHFKFLILHSAVVLYNTVKRPPDPSGPLSSLTDISVSWSWRPRLCNSTEKWALLEARQWMRANVDVSSHRSAVQLQHLVPGEIKHAPPTISMTRTRTSKFGEIKLNPVKFYAQYNVPAFGKNFPSWKILAIW